LREKLYDFDDIAMILLEAERLISDQDYKVSSLSVMNLVSKSDCSVYDCEFFALAKLKKTILITQDKKY
jgi:predicted nucleic acid-binding protein